MMLCRCDLCGEEVKNFRSIEIKRTVIVNGNPTAVKSAMVDVCSDKCETQAVSEMLIKLVPSATVEAQASPEPKQTINPNGSITYHT